MDEDELTGPSDEFGQPNANNPVEEDELTEPADEVGETGWRSPLKGVATRLRRLIKSPARYT